MKIKALLLILLPIVAGGVLISVLLAVSAQSRLEERSMHFGNAIADQLALTLTDQLVREDLLSLNVMLSDLVARGTFKFASVYSADNRLLAQAGRNSADALVFTRDVTFQNASAGYVQLGLTHDYIDSPVRAIVLLAATLHITVAVVIGLAIWFYGDMLYLWWSAPAHRPPAVAATADTAGEPDSAPPAFLTILVIKVRPVRQLDAYRKALTQALSLYGGKVETTEGDDFLVTLSTRDQVFDAVCCGTLIRTIMKLAHGNCHVKLGMHSISATASAGSIGKARKHATYLASISDDEFLASREVYSQAGQTGRMVLKAFASSLAPDGEVYRVESLSADNQALIESQARQLA